MRLIRIAMIALLSIVLGSSFACSTDSQSTATPMPSIHDAAIIYEHYTYSSSDLEAYISGRVQNVGNTKLSLIEITVDWYELRPPGNTNVMRSDKANVYDLDTGMVADFKINYGGAYYSSGSALIAPATNYSVYVSEVQ